MFAHKIEKRNEGDREAKAIEKKTVQKMNIQTTRSWMF